MKPMIYEWKNKECPVCSILLYIFKKVDRLKQTKNL